MKKLLTSILVGTVFSLLSFPVLAAGNSAPKATGDYGYNIGDGLQRHAQFNAITTAIGCDFSWDVSGDYTVALTVDGTPYTEYLKLQQSGDNLTGVSLALDQAQTSSVWHIDSGTVSGTTVTIFAHFQNNTSMKLEMNGVISGDGTISGTWHDVDWNSRSGNWSTTAGTATMIPSNGCTGKGSFNYSDANGTYYGVDVKYVTVSGNTAWFAGPVVSGNFGNFGQWLFVKVTDNGEPGTADITSGEFPLTEAQANVKVASHATPSTQATITEGNIQVH